MVNNNWHKEEDQVVRKPIVSKTPVWKVMALGAGIGLAMLSYPVHAAPVSGGDTVQGLYQPLLSTMKNGRTSGRAGALRSWSRSFAGPSTFRRWPGCRSALPGPL